MKSVHGLVVALALGIVGAMLNWFYLDQRSRDVVEKVGFIGVKEGVTVRRGDPLREDQLVQVEVPRKWVGQLQNTAYYWKDLATVVGQSPKEDKLGGELLMRQDLKTPPREFKLGPDQFAYGVPVDTGSTVTQMIDPGQLVSFIVGKSPQAMSQPTPAEGADGGPLTPIPDPSNRNSMSEIIGPFKVLSLGNRLGSVDVMQANHISPQQENVIMVALQLQGGQLDAKASKLVEALQQSGNRRVGVLVHPRVQPNP
jgi:hypothetical protein